ncbi:MAG: DUF1611 domain-containing protein [Woeseiaceae bacterium]|nr:DUF1611 domain-containing protein [Woeseiaceae bacterium]
MTQIVAGSLARIADFDTTSFDTSPIARSDWTTGDYVVAEVTETPSDMNLVENCIGDMIPVAPGDRIIGALGCRAATLEGVGSWRDVRHDRMQLLTGAGLLGAFTSYSAFLPEPASLRYQGHIVRGGRKATMNDFALQCSAGKYTVPTILLIGTSMSAGKTTTGRLACELLTSAGLRVTGVKLTGAGRYRDILAFRDSGASEIFDFVDVGLPSTVVPEDRFRAAIRPLLRHIASRQPDVAVVEAGASPLEPYNGAAAIDELNNSISCTILCASDPYAVVGVQKSFDFSPDLVAGPATNTSAAIDLVEKLSGLRGINVMDPDSVPEFRSVLAAKLNLKLD